MFWRYFIRLRKGYILLSNKFSNQIYELRLGLKNAETEISKLSRSEQTKEIKSLKETVYEKMLEIKIKEEVITKRNKEIKRLNQIIESYKVLAGYLEKVKNILNNGFEL